MSVSLVEHYPGEWMPQRMAGNLRRVFGHSSVPGMVRVHTPVGDSRAPAPIPICAGQNWWTVVAEEKSVMASRWLTQTPGDMLQQQ
jgi:hypothetical protein